MKKMIIKMILSSIYTAVFYLIYKYYLYPVFEYASYTYIQRGISFLLPTLAFSVIPVLAISNKVRVSVFFTVAIYLLVYVPTMVMIPLRLPISQIEQIRIQLIYLIGMIIIAFSTHGTVRGIHVRSFVSGDKMLFFLTLSLTAYLWYIYRGSISFVSFADVYEQRFRTNEIGTIASGYITMFLSNVFFPFHVVNGFLRKKLSHFIIGVGGMILIYGITAAKMTLLSLVAMFAFLLVKLGRKNIFERLTLLLSAVSAVVLALPNLNESIRWGKSLLFMRTLSTGGWTNLSYYETFKELPKTYYSHIGIINKLLRIYPFDGLALGQVIGLKYSGTSAANFNAGFWASDGIAALGTIGVIVISIVVFFFFRFFDQISHRAEKSSLFVFLIPFLVTFINIPLGTALLSGGGLFIAFILLLGVFPKLPENTNALMNRY